MSLTSLKEINENFKNLMSIQAKIAEDHQMLIQLHNQTVSSPDHTNDINDLKKTVKDLDEELRFVKKKLQLFEKFFNIEELEKEAKHLERRRSKEKEKRRKRNQDDPIIKPLARSAPVQMNPRLGPYEYGSMPTGSVPNTTFSPQRTFSPSPIANEDNEYTTIADIQSKFIKKNGH